MTYTAKRRFARGYLFVVFIMLLTTIFPVMVYANDGDAAPFDAASAAADAQQYIVDNGGEWPSGLRYATTAPAEPHHVITRANGDPWRYVTDAQLQAWKGGSSTIRGQIEQQGEGINLKPNVGRAFELFSGVQDPIAVILGIIALAIMHVLPLSAALDTLYLISPEFSNKVEEKKENSSGNGGMVREGKNGKKYMRWISREAQDALEKSYETGQPPYKQFLVFLVIKYVMAALLMAFVFTGNYMQLLYGAMGLIEGLTKLLG